MPKEENKPRAAESDSQAASTITRWPMPAGEEIVIEVRADGAVFVNGDFVTPFIERT